MKDRLVFCFHEALEKAFYKYENIVPLKYFYICICIINLSHAENIRKNIIYKHMISILFPVHHLVIGVGSQTALEFQEMAEDKETRKIKKMEREVKKAIEKQNKTKAIYSVLFCFPIVFFWCFLVFYCVLWRFLVILFVTVIMCRVWNV